MSWRWLLLVAAAFVACSGGGVDLPSTILIPEDDLNCTPDDDSVLPDVVDRIGHGEVVTDDATSYHLTAPIDAQAVPHDPPFTFRWAAPMAASGPRHRCGNGTFVLLHFEGLGAPLDVFGGCVMDGCAPLVDWTPDTATWKRFQDAAGDVTVTVTTAPYARYSANGDLTRPTDATTTFRVATP